MTDCCIFCIIWSLPIHFMTYLEVLSPITEREKKNINYITLKFFALKICKKFFKIPKKRGNITII